MKKEYKFDVLRLCTQFSQKNPPRNYIRDGLFFIDTRNKYCYSNCSDYFDYSAAEQVAAADFADTAEGCIEDYRADYIDNYKADSDINHLRSVESYR